MEDVQIKKEYLEQENSLSKKVFGELNVLKSADGSALITDYSCQTQILAAVHGPADVRETRQLHGQMAINVTFLKEQQPMYEVENEAEMSGNHVGNHGGNHVGKNKNLSDAFDIQENRQEVVNSLVTTNLPLNLQQNSIEQDIKSMLYESLVLKHFKRAELMVTVQVLQNCGNIRSNTLNAVVLALLDAGVPMKCTPLAVEYEDVDSDKIDGKIEDGYGRDNGGNRENNGANSENTYKNREPAETLTNYVFLFDNRDGYKSLIQSSINGKFSLEEYKLAIEGAKKKLDCYRGLHMDAVRAKFNDLF